MEPSFPDENEFPANPLEGFRYRSGSVVASTAKTIATLAVAFVWAVVVYLCFSIVVWFVASIHHAVVIELVVIGCVAVFGIAIGFPIVIRVQRVMRYDEVDFENRVIRIPSNNLTPFGLPRREVPFAAVGNIRLVSRPQWTGRTLHRFELLPYQSTDAITNIRRLGRSDADANATLDALKKMIISVDTPSDAIFSSTLARVPAAPERGEPGA